jgi:hypothetical protein
VTAVLSDESKASPSSTESSGEIWLSGSSQ